MLMIHYVPNQYGQVHTFLHFTKFNQNLVCLL